MSTHCRDCAYKVTEYCLTKKRCKQYLPITPSCANCAITECDDAFSVEFCDEWEADYNNPFIRLLQDIAQQSNEVVDNLECPDLLPASNFLTHTMDHLNITPYPRQLLEASLFFNEICFDCSNPDYHVLYDEDMGDILDNVVFMEKGTCPKCGKTAQDLIKSPHALKWVSLPGIFEELVGVAGQRGGKSQLFAMIASYVWQRYLCIEGSPSRFFGLDAGTKLHMTFVALTFGQAKDTLWDPFSHYLRNSWWFKDYHAYIAEKSDAQGIDNAVRFEETFILYKHKNLQCAPLGPDKRTLRGRTRFLFGIDELGWFSGGKSAVKLNPDEVYTALSNSLKTIRAASRKVRKKTKDPWCPTAYAVNISSPRSARDGIMRLLYKSRKIQTVHAFHIPTWEMNPTLTEEDFADDFAKDPVVAKRDFGAFPPLAHSPYISEMGPILDRLTKKVNIAQYNMIMVQNKRKTETFISLYLKNLRKAKKPMLMGIDAGYSGNAFGITLTSLNYDQQVIVEAAIEAKPVDGMKVHFVHIYNTVIKKLLETYNVIGVFVDRWQSIDLSQRIEDEFEIPCIRYSLTYKDFEFIRQKILGNQIKIGKPENKLTWQEIIAGVRDYEDFFLGKPIAHLLLQIASVQDSGRRIEKGEDLDDDIFRALCLCIHFSMTEDFKYELLHNFGEENAGVGGLAIAGKTVTSQQSIVSSGGSANQGNVVVHANSVAVGRRM